MSVKRVGVSWNGRGAKRILQASGQKGLKKAGLHMLTLSLRIVPLDQGTLFMSGSVDQVDKDVAISYDTPYAVRQHEEITYSHQRGRQAKYLESIVQSEAVQEEVLRVLGKELGDKL